MAHLAQIDNDSNSRSGAISADAGAKKAAVQGSLAGARSGVASLTDDVIGQVDRFLGEKQDSVTNWILSRLQAVQGLAASLTAQANAAAGGAAAAVEAATNAATSAVVRSVEGVGNQILGVASSIKIPDIPGLGAIRDSILGLAQRVVLQIRRALESVQAVIKGVVNSAMSLVRDFVAAVAGAISRAVTALVRQLTSLVQKLAAQFSALRSRVSGALRSTLSKADTQLAHLESTSVAHIEDVRQESLHAVLEVRQAGRRAIVAAVTPPGKSRKAGQAATPSPAQGGEAPEHYMAQRVKQIGDANARIEKDFDRASSPVVAQVASAAANVFGRFQQGLGKGFAELRAGVAGKVSAISGMVGDGVSQVSSGLTSTASSAHSSLESSVADAQGRIHKPADALSGTAQSIPERVRSFFTGLLSRVGSLLSGGSGSQPLLGQEVPGVTGDLQRAQSPAAAAFALPALWPLIAPAAGGAAEGGMIAGIVACFASGICEIAAAIALIVVVLILLVYLVVLIVEAVQLHREQEREKESRRKREEEKERKKKEEEERKKKEEEEKEKEKEKKKVCEKPFYWDPIRFSAKAQPGALDSCLVPDFEIHAHHSWPMYIGGLPEQPLMGISGLIHISILHPALDAALASAFAQDGFLGRGKNNSKFVQRLRTNRALRRQVSAALTFFYGGWSAGFCNPGIPFNIYAAGIGASLVALGGP